MINEKLRYMRKKLLIINLLGAFFTSVTFSQNVDHVAGDNAKGGHFLKRVEYNYVMSYDMYNIQSKSKIEKLFFGYVNAPVEFVYSPSFEGHFGFRVIRDSLGKTILEIKYITNFDEAVQLASQEANYRRNLIDLPIEVLNSFPREVFNLIWDYNNRTIVEKNPEEKPTRLKVKSLSFPISEQFAEKLYEKIVSFIDKFKAKGVPHEISDGYSVTFRTVVDDEVWSLWIHEPEGNALKMADICRQIITDAIAGKLDESKYISVLNAFKTDS